jgi:hypothetical protein
VTETEPHIVLIDDLDVVDDESTPIRVPLPSGPRQVSAFARLAEVVHRVPMTEVPSDEPTVGDPGILVHTRPPEPSGPGPRLRQEALDALTEAEAGHEAAVAHSHERWQTVHECERQAADMIAEEAAALRKFELLRDSRRIAERTLRQARAEAEAASQHCLTTSRVLDGARIRAERSVLR